MKEIGIAIFFLMSFFIGAFAHEKDMERNFLKTGDTEAWFSDISCNVKSSEVIK